MDFEIGISREGGREGGRKPEGGSLREEGREGGRVGGWEGGRVGGWVGGREGGRALRETHTQGIRNHLPVPSPAPTPLPLPLPLPSHNHVPSIDVDGCIALGPVGKRGRKAHRHHHRHTNKAREHLTKTHTPVTLKAQRVQLHHGSN